MKIQDGRAKSEIFGFMPNNFVGVKFMYISIPIWGLIRRDTCQATEVEMFYFLLTS
ncbi:MAG: hypothetical protein A4E59_00527 [Syntrophorhabdus sp. PtaB.Bin027]|jgi:hypothetical protein|nr:MAG: hypothetical protein A4E59_00527 [Syntrophorhabdus sp. PtaB.Bin027]OQB78158.1 MAG: hypothetical protein BWX92_00318 [Deltaproteobacteria bacterium ADurb.Bin135]